MFIFSESWVPGFCVPYRACILHVKSHMLPLHKERDRKTEFERETENQRDRETKNQRGRETERFCLNQALKSLNLFHIYFFNCKHRQSHKVHLTGLL